MARATAPFLDFKGAYHLWRKIPSRKLSIGLEADERFSRVTGWTEAS